MANGWLAALFPLLIAGCGDSSAERAKKAGAQLAAGLVSALESSADNATPHLCASWPTATSAPRRFELAGAAVVVTGPELAIEADEAAIVAVADARGSATAAARTRELVEGLPEDVRVVLALGGMGRNKRELVAALGPLVSARWALVAMPGDRESVDALGAAIADLGRGGRAVFDGTAIRSITGGGMRVVTIPGIAAESGLAAGTEGCVHRPEDAADAAARLAAHDGGPRILASYAAPRQRGDGGSDLADGVHAGEPELSAAVAASKALLILHGQIEPRPVAGDAGIARTPAFIAVGPLERSPALLGLGTTRFAGVIARRAGNGVRWVRIKLER